MRPQHHRQHEELHDTETSSSYDNRAHWAYPDCEAVNLFKIGL
jgi:hypothetical protein